MQKYCVVSFTTNEFARYTILLRTVYGLHFVASLEKKQVSLSCAHTDHNKTFFALSLKIQVNIDEVINCIVNICGENPFLNIYVECLMKNEVNIKT